MKGANVDLKNSAGDTASALAAKAGVTLAPHAEEREAPKAEKRGKTFPATEPAAKRAKPDDGGGASSGRRLFPASSLRSSTGCLLTRGRRALKKESGSMRNDHRGGAS